MKVFLADLVHNCVAGDNQISGSQDFVVPLNIASIASCAKDNFEGPLEISLFKYPDELFSALKTQKPDVIGFSNYIWNKDLNSRIGSLIKEQHPETVIFMGGPSIRTDRQGIEDFLRHNRFIDLYIILEGEWVLLELLRIFAAEGRSFLDRDLDLPGCAYLADGKLIYRESKQDGNVEELSSPYLDGMLDDFLEKGLIPLFETNRGCPFNCTFCTWGLSNLNKVRTFPLESVYMEMDYVASKFPDLPVWIIADANFGLLGRDVEIAGKIRDIKKKTPALRTVVIWESKNARERNLDIARILGHDIGDVLIAVQTLDPTAQKNIKRANMDLSDLSSRIGQLHAAGSKAATHVLSGLPGESYQGHLETLRKCFDLDFDHVQVFSTLLLPGSEMETRQSRDTFKLQTKYRIRQGGYGEYHGIKSVDCEEIIRATSVISENEMLSLRLVHWLIWYGWNHGFLKPILQFVHREHRVNPLDMILEIISNDNRNYPEIDTLFSNFLNDAEAEWFDNIESLHEFYLRPRRFDDLMKNGFSKVEFKYNALMILDTGLFHGLLDVIVNIVHRHDSSFRIDELVRVIREMRIEPDSFFTSDFAEEKKMKIHPEIGTYVADLRSQEVDAQSNSLYLKLRKSVVDKEKIKAQLVKYCYEKNKLYAIEKSLGMLPDAFVYNASMAG